MKKSKPRASRKDPSHRPPHNHLYDVRFDQNREPKMSEILLELVRPWTNRFNYSPERLEALIVLGIMGWNKAILPEVWPKSRAVMERQLASVMPDDLALCDEIIDAVAKQALVRFPHVNKIVLDYEVSISGTDISLNVTFAPRREAAGAGSAPQEAGR